MADFFPDDKRDEVLDFYRIPLGDHRALAAAYAKHCGKDIEDVAHATGDEIYATLYEQMRKDRYVLVRRRYGLRKGDGNKLTALVVEHCGWTRFKASCADSDDMIRALYEHMPARH